MLTTLMTFMTTLPIILPVWKEKPLPPQFLTYESENFRSTAEEIAFQKGAFKIGDPALVLQTLRILGSVKEVDSAKVIYTFLKSEKDPILRAAGLNYLYDLPVIEENMKYALIMEDDNEIYDIEQFNWSYQSALKKIQKTKQNDHNS